MNKLTLSEYLVIVEKRCERFADDLYPSPCRKCFVRADVEAMRKMLAYMNKHLDIMLPDDADKTAFLVALEALIPEEK